MIIEAILEAAFITSAIYAVGILTKHKMKTSVYCFLFLVFLIVAMFYGPSLHAEVPNAKVEIRQIRAYLNSLETKLSKEDKKFYQDKVRFHQNNGERCEQDAKNKCWWLPDFEDRENAKYCWTAIGTIITPADPKSKFIALLVEALIYYGINAIDEWVYIKNKLHWSEYHYEMMEFYQEVLKQGM
jgi:hypothetical protein